MLRCPDNTFTNDTSDCFAECSALTYQKTYQDSTSENYCVQACTEETHIYQQDGKCVPQCAAGKRITDYESLGIKITQSRLQCMDICV